MVKRVPNAGSRFVLDQAVTSAADAPTAISSAMTSPSDPCATSFRCLWSGVPHQFCPRAVSDNRVKYVEIPRAGHAFDLVDTSTAQRLAVETTTFLTSVREGH